MGAMSFLLPADMTTETSQELERACVAGGPDNMPWLTEVVLEPGHMTLRREVDESGCLVAPWLVDGAGLLMGTSGTLMERAVPYQLQLELARGKINQLRCQTADWQTGGLQVSANLAQQIRAAASAFSKAVIESPSEATGRHAQAALAAGYQASEQLVKLYVEQMFQTRHQRQPRLETALGCRLGTFELQKYHVEALSYVCNSICLPFAWKDVAAEEGQYLWQPHDAQLCWAEEQGLIPMAGPLIDFSPGQLPDRVLTWNGDLPSLAGSMCRYVEAAVRRYRNRIRIWQLTTAGNCASVAGLGEDELLWLTVQLVEAARQVDPALGLVVGIAQPWGDYLAVEDRTHSPFVFADTLIRAGLNLAALDLEIIMGVSPAGSYCRDLLETSRLIDLYSLLGAPLRITLAYPSSTAPDPNADPAYRVDSGHWRGSYDPEVQAEWANLFVALALCKPTVKSVQWSHLSDAFPHQFPHCGLFDMKDRPKPVLKQLQELRESHLR